MRATAVIEQKTEERTGETHQIALNGPLGGGIALVAELRMQIPNRDLARVARNIPQHEPLAQERVRHGLLIRECQLVRACYCGTTGQWKPLIHEGALDPMTEAET